MNPGDIFLSVKDLGGDAATDSSEGDDSDDDNTVGDAVGDVVRNMVDVKEEPPASPPPAPPFLDGGEPSFLDATTTLANGTPQPTHPHRPTPRKSGHKQTRSTSSSSSAVFAERGKIMWIPSKILFHQISVMLGVGQMLAKTHDKIPPLPSPPPPEAPDRGGERWG